jgi:hypothetical protein
LEAWHQLLPARIRAVRHRISAFLTKEGDPGFA